MNNSPLYGLDYFDLQIRQALADSLNKNVEDFKLERPRDEKLGDFALPCFRFAKDAGKNPAELANFLATELVIENTSANAAGPFLNFTISRDILAERISRDCESKNYADGQLSGRVVVEYSSPNIAKPMHVGHLRSTAIGACLGRLASKLGHDVVRINHLGDWGSQFGKLVAAWQRWGDEEQLKNAPIKHLLDLYVRYHQLEKEDETLGQEAKVAFKELESGDDNQTRATWKTFNELSLSEFNRTFTRLGCDFDFVRGESWYEDKLDETLNWLEECGITEEDEGATLIKLDDHGIKTPCLVKTSHGTTLYATRDLAAARSRWSEFEFERMLYVFGGEQTLHFNQFSTVLKKGGCDWAERMEHIPFGMIRLGEGKLSTRQGRVLTLEDVLDRAVELALEVIEEKNPDLANKQDTAEMVGVGAVIFHDLKHQRQKDVIFDWKEVLSFEGDTGPYLQYTHARCCAILRKADRPTPNYKQIDSKELADSPELLIALGRYPLALREAWEKREPMVLATYLLKLGAAGNFFYKDKRVLGSGEATESARLYAIDMLRRILADGLAILGVPTPNEM